jgi:hypothetical protein
MAKVDIDEIEKILREENKNISDLLSEGRVSDEFFDGYRL